MKKIIIFIIIAVILIGCKKTGEINEVKRTELKYRLSYQTPQKMYWINIHGFYVDRDDFYITRTYNMPKDTIIIVPKGKLLKSTLELKTINGVGNVEIEVYKNGKLIEVLIPDNDNKIFYIWQ